jgi:PAS domain-containing protein
VRRKDQEKNAADRAVEPSAGDRQLCPDLVRAVGDGLLVVDRDGVIRHAQGAACRELGADRGQRVEEALPRLWPKLALTLLDRKRRTEPAVRIG